ncbi:MAG: hypothetical protein ACI92I_000322 [Acidimicrobiales bacterium]|jgi:hypothetical protein
MLQERTSIKLRSHIQGLKITTNFVSQNYYSGQPHEPYFENWHLWFRVIHDGSNPFLPFGANKGWKFAFMHAKVEDIPHFLQEETPKDYIFILHPHSTLKAAVVTDKYTEAPGVTVFFRTSGYDQSSPWFNELLFPYQCA